MMSLAAWLASAAFATFKAAAAQSRNAMAFLGFAEPTLPPPFGDALVPFLLGHYRTRTAPLNDGYSEFYDAWAACALGLGPGTRGTCLGFAVAKLLRKGRAAPEESIIVTFSRDGASTCPCNALPRPGVVAELGLKLTNLLIATTRLLEISKTLARSLGRGHAS